MINVNAICRNILGHWRWSANSVHKYYFSIKMDFWCNLKLQSYEDSWFPFLLSEIIDIYVGLF